VIGSLFGALLLPLLSAQTWTADNGNGTFTNPLFYDEFSDPDMIRVGQDFYLSGHDDAQHAWLCPSFTRAMS
jgi:xylan 1,4-beta-xylosidase